jgi:hypothetical protein
VFAWIYKDLKGITPTVAQHCIEQKNDVPSTHQALYWMNPNYANIVKHDVDNLLKAGFIKLVEEGTWLSPLSLFLRKMGSCAYVLTTGSSV